MFCCRFGRFDVATKNSLLGFGLFNLNYSPKQVMLVVDLCGLFQVCQGWDITWQEA
jgi:hypothetical protein